MHPSSERRGALLVAALGLGLALSSALTFVPGLPKEELVRTSLWGIAVLSSFAGFGDLVGRLCWPRARVSLSLRAVWGASAVAAVGGLLASASLLHRMVIELSVPIGIAVLVAAWWSRREELFRSLGARARASRLHLSASIVAVVLGAAVLIHYVGAASDVSSNPYDDDVSYYPFARQLLERGTLIDPFSFRRMSTLGGQALYHALLLARVPALHLNLFDRGMCLVLAAGLVASQRVDGRRGPFLVRALAVAFLVALPNTSINSASYYSGVVFFLALFRTVDELPGDLEANAHEAVRRCTPLALVAAATCTLRQNYQATVGLFLVLSYAAAVWNLRRTRELRARLIEPATALLLTFAFVLPWLVLLYRSNLTFLFPLMKGTFEPGVEVKSQLMTFGKQLRFFVEVWLSPEPITTLPLFALAALSVRDRRPRAGLAAQWAAGTLSLVLLAWSFSLADAGNLARYDYGFFTASALLTFQSVATRGLSTLHGRSVAGKRAADLLAAAVVAFALLAPLETYAWRTRKMLDTRLRDASEMLRRSVPMQPEPPVAAAYRRLQDKVPPGARLLVLLDEPYHLHFGRNEIWNLDMPGTASLPPGIPAFQGPDPVAAYFRDKGIRYVAFVRSERSTHLYRREIWVDHLYDPDEIWRVYAPYMVDVMDNLAALATTRAILHDEAGMVLLDLEGSR